MWCGGVELIPNLNSEAFLPRQNGAVPACQQNYIAGCSIGVLDAKAFIGADRADWTPRSAYTLRVRFPERYVTSLL